MFRLSLKIKLVFVLLCIFVMGGAGLSHAQKITKAYVELGTKVKMTKSHFDENSEEYKKEVQGESLLTHQFRLPNGWTDISGENKALDFSSDVETKLSSFVGLPNMYARSSFSVLVLTLEREVELLHWYYTYMSAKGYSVTGMKAMDGGVRVEAESIKMNVEATFVVRSVAILSGNNVVIAEYAVPDPFWQEQHDEALWSIASFYLLFKDDKTIEPRKEFSILDIVRFNYPASWDIRVPKLTVVDELSAAAISRNALGELDGRVDSFFLASHVGGEREDNLEMYKKKYKDIVSFTIGEHMETIDGVDYHKTISAGRIDVFNALTPDGQSQTGYEIWMTILESDIYDGYVFMNTVGRNVDFMTWSKNQRSYKIMVESMELHGQPR
jgi:hypothetical protein|tara:strand:- start:94104 stop:95255 length:1152 start_codon:yes stop_codon:yes gene_type:complete